VLHQRLEIDDFRGTGFEGENVEGRGQHDGQPADLLLENIQAGPGADVGGTETFEDLEMHDHGVERTPQVVQEPVEVRRQRRHQVMRADFTAWIPYLASLL
jgi:hypothetical protein